MTLRALAIVDWLLADAAALAWMGGGPSPLLLAALVCGLAGYLVWRAAA